MAKTAKKRKNVAKTISKREIEKRARDKARLDTAQATTSTAGKRLTKKEVAQIRTRDELVTQYMPYAASIAARVCQTLSSAVDYDDVLCNARLGLLEAAKRYDRKYEVDFRTFAYYRIKGAIYDGLRRSGWLPRSLYAKLKYEEAANNFLQHKSSSATTGGFDENVVSETVNSLASIYVVSMDANEDFEIEDESSDDVEKRTEFMQVRKYMRQAIASMPDKEKHLIMMYYFQNKTLEEVGEKLGLSKSWTSRLHARALAILFKRIRSLACSQAVDLEDTISMEEEE